MCQSFSFIFTVRKYKILVCTKFRVNLTETDFYLKLHSSPTVKWATHTYRYMPQNCKSVNVCVCVWLVVDMKKKKEKRERQSIRKIVFTHKLWVKRVTISLYLQLSFQSPVSRFLRLCWLCDITRWRAFYCDQVTSQYQTLIFHVSCLKTNSELRRKTCS